MRTSTSADTTQVGLEFLPLLKQRLVKPIIQQGKVSVLAADGNRNRSGETLWSFLGGGNSSRNRDSTYGALSRYLVAGISSPLSLTSVGRIAQPFFRVTNFYNRKELMKCWNLWKSMD